MSGLLKSNVVVALGTALSRVTGLLRVGVFAAVIGQTALADAYNLANNSPNAVYELLLGGVLSASLVPLFTRHAEEDDDDATSAVVTVAVIALTALTIVAVLAAPWVVRIFTVNISDGVDPEQFRGAATALARIFLVQILFYGISALANSLLQARRRFFAAAWAPVLSNVVVIAALLLVPGTVDGRQPQLADVLSSRRAPVDPRPRRDARHRGDGARRHPGAACGRRPPAVPAGVAAPGGAPAAEALVVDARLRRRQPARDHRGAEPRRAREHDPRRLHEGVHLLRAPTRPAGDVDRHHVHARDGRARCAITTGPRSSTARRSVCG